MQPRGLFRGTFGAGAALERSPEERRQPPDGSTVPRTEHAYRAAARREREANTQRG